MPVRKGKSKKVMKENSEELGQGKTYAHTKANFGKAAAGRQRVAIVMKAAAKSYPRVTTSDHPRKRKA